MRVNIITNLANGVGLQRDYEILRLELEARGHQVRGVQYNAKPFVVQTADLNIFIEVVNPLALRAAPEQWVIPNPEWWFKDWDQYPYDKVLAKTRDCELLFRQKFGDRCQYIGWRARDLYRPTIRRERKFLHIAGKSQFKNTEAVVEGCKNAGIPVTVIRNKKRRVNETDLCILMNSHFCHIMPSAYEGYGHVLHESQSVGQILITTDAPPMNEVVPAICIPSVKTRPHHAAVLHQVSPLDVAEAVRFVKAMPQDEVDLLHSTARKSYEQDVVEFQQVLDQLVGKR